MITAPPRTPGHSPGGASTLYVKALLDYLAHTGIDPATLFDAEFVARADKPGQRISVARWLGMFEQAIAATGDNELPLKVAAQMQPKYLGLIGFAIMSSQTLGDVIDILLRYERLVDDVNETRLVVADEKIELHWVPLHGPTSPIFMQLSLATWTVLSRQITGQPDMSVEAHFCFSRPDKVATFERIFGHALYFDQPTTKLVFAEKYLDLAISFPNPEVHRLLIAQAEASLQDIVRPDWLQALHESLVQHMASGKTSLAHQAAYLGMAPRTLQYRLNEYGLSYRELLDGVRKELALRYLEDARLSLSDIAFLLGYAEQSAFHHAFKRWTGQSPQAVRASATVTGRATSS